VCCFKFFIGIQIHILTVRYKHNLPKDCLKEIKRIFKAKILYLPNLKHIGFINNILDWFCELGKLIHWKDPKRSVIWAICMIFSQFGALQHPGTIHFHYIKKKKIHDILQKKKMFHKERKASHKTSIDNIPEKGNGWTLNELIDAATACQRVSRGRIQLFWFTFLKAK